MPARSALGGAREPLTPGARAGEGARERRSHVSPSPTLPLGAPAVSLPASPCLPLPACPQLLHSLTPLPPASAVNDSKLNVNVLEAVAPEELDPEEVKKGLAQYTAAYASASDDLAKEEAQIGVDCYQAMTYAIDEL